MLSRRTFLASSALALAAAPRAIGADAPSNKLTMGFIGLGTMGRGHLGRFLGTKDVEVVAVCDVVKERRESAAEKVEKAYGERKKSGNYAGVKQFEDFRELLAVPGLDAVLIATPDHWHAIPCLAAIKAKKHIYCEKPLTHCIVEGRLIADAVAKAGITFQTGSQQRSEFGNHFRDAVEAVWNGRIGKLQTVRIGVGGPAVKCDLKGEPIPDGTNWDLWQGPVPVREYNSALCPKGVHSHFPAWRNYREYAGGGLADMGAHHFDIAQWAMHRDDSGPSKITPPKDPKANAGLVFEYDDGIKMFHNVFEGNRSGDCVFEGEDGRWVIASRGGIKSSDPAILKDPLPKDAKRVMAVRSHADNWLAAIRDSKKQTIASAETGHRTATICHLAQLGYELGEPLTWDPAKEEFVDSAKANARRSYEYRGPWKMA